MKIPQMIAAELRRLVSTRMSVIALIALLAVPILYGGLYLWANQDPYAKLDQVPVALIVSDTGAEIANQHRNIGEEVAKELLDSETFAWSEVSASDAQQGLDDGRFDFAVEIPADFTTAIASISTSAPHAADIILHTNDANNYLASTIGNQAVQKIRTTITEKVVTEAGRTMLDGIDTIRLKLVDAADGATQLVDGLTTALDGSSTLATGTSDLATGLATLATGASSLADGTTQLATGADSLHDGASKIADGTAQLDEVAQRVSQAANDIDGALPTARADITRILTEQGVSQDRIDAVLAALDPISQHVDSANGRVQDAVSKIDQLATGATALRDGAATLATGAHTAADGASALLTGATSASDGATKIKDGTASLRDGIAQLHDGAGTLQDGLATGAASLPDNDADTRAAQAATLGTPVDVSTTAITQAQNYGAGLAPFFAALAAWIGIYALFLIVKPISKRAVTALHSPVRITIAGWATPALLGALQMLGLFGVLAITLGFQFANPVQAFGLLVLASATYTAIILALNVWLGSVGQFLGLVLMVLQLVTAGGTFPWQTLPAPLAALHHILPMGYVVDAMRQIMYAGGGVRVLTDIAVLLTWLVGALILAIIGVTRMTHFRTLRDLEPSVIG